jgi:Tannase-like family of unknown function (DUF6351)
MTRWLIPIAALLLTRGALAALSLQVLSSPPQYVSGGDARIQVTLPAASHASQLELRLNGQPLPVQWTGDPARPEAVIAGLVSGRNQLVARLGSERAALTLTNHPITGPMFSGPQQMPFVCRTNQGAVKRQPKVDRATPPGYRVTDDAGNVIGYSTSCSIDTFVAWHYRNTAGALVPMPADGSRPPDMSQVTLSDGRTVDFIVRREIGTINRFLYSIAMLVPASDRSDAPDTSLWNRRLLYWFQGGVAIGHTQGSVHSGSVNLDILGRGYAIVHSSGNNTGTHYNMRLAGETAMMTKERFVERYGAPLYTVGLGGSGGAIQQYMLAQNQPGILDALLPVQSYPDMVTQTIHIGDCELLEYYMDATDRGNPKWQTTKNRTLLVGLNAEDSVPDPLIPFKNRWGYATAPGSTECINAWRGLTPLAMNPRFGEVPNQDQWEPQSDIAAIRWTHYDDLRNIYLVEPDGDARPTWDNVGVQYGLRSLRDGRITPSEFLRLNWHVGGWRHPSRMVQEGFPYLGTDPEHIARALLVPGYFDPWSRRNAITARADRPAPRTQGDPVAMRRAYTTGHVFDGRLEVPTIDHRQYLERELDMHNAHQSFAMRRRLLNRMGHSDPAVIWFTDTMPGQPRASQSLEALEVMDEWMINFLANPAAGIVASKPARAVDACFDLAGQRIAGGAGVWDGILDSRPPGACTQRFPLYTTSRIVAGAPIEGSIYRCALKPVEQAVADGTYGAWTPDSTQLMQLQQIFPDGVCDYSKPDRARP